MSDTRFGLPEKAIEKMSAVFAHYPEVDRVVLYGSRAKGNFKVGSDIDLTLIGKNLNLETQFSIENELDDLLLPWIIDLSIYSHIKNEDLLKHIDQVGKTFSTNATKSNT